MKKTYKKVLNNGLYIYMVHSKKNRCGAKIVVNAGGHNISYIDKEGNKKNLKKGIAHFLEHYLIEKSIYGNLGKYYLSESMRFNGATYFNRTEFYFSTVHDFKEALIRLIRLVNQPAFNEKDMEEIKKPVIEEIKRSLDNRNRQELKKIDNAYYYNYLGDVTLGDIETIESLTIEDIKEFYNTFYSTNNQILTIYCNFDKKEILDIINNEYKDNKNDIVCERVIEPVNVKEKELDIIDEKEDEMLLIRFKIDVSKYSNWDIFHLDACLFYLNRINLSLDSKLFKELRDKNLTIYSIQTETNYIKEIKMIDYEIIVYTSEFDTVKEMILNTINNIDYDKELFEIIRNNLILSFINKEEKAGFQINSWLENYLEYDLDYVDTLEDIKKDNIKDMKETLNKIDFSNYLVVRRMKKERNV